MTNKSKAAIATMALPPLIWLSTFFQALSGPWSLPFGVLLPWLGGCCVVLALAMQILGKSRWLWVLFAGMNTFILIEDIRFKSPEASGFPVMSWNLATPQSDEMTCIIPAIREWQSKHPDSLFFFQEISKRNQLRLEQETTLECEGASYYAAQDCANKNQDTCPGLAICAPESWSFRRAHHNDFVDNRAYGFFQSELKHSTAGKYINAMNVHLESLWRTQYSTGTKGSWKTLSANQKKQQGQLEEIVRVIDALQDPVLLIGDFNSLSSQWLHRQLRETHKDAHRETGWGFGSSIPTSRYWLPLRTDHLYAEPPLSWSGPTRAHGQINCSDHVPITGFFSLKTNTGQP